MKKVIIPSMIGNALEWYDFALYGQLSVIISKLFFPASDHYTAFFATFSVFAVGFLMRPLGGILFSHIGDKYGRKTSLVAAILCMAIPTTFIGLMPTYEQIGILAPILLTIIRLVQGLALGGGSSGSIAFVIEHSPDNKRGLMGSSSVCSMGLGILLGLVVSYSLSSFLSVADFESWGWRIAFIISFFIGLVAIYIKNYLHDSPAFVNAQKHGEISKTPIRDLFTEYRSTLFTAIGIYMTVTVPFYTLTIFMNNYIHKILHHSMRDTIIMNVAAILAHISVVPFAAHLSDKIGRKPVLIATTIAFMLLSYPMFVMMSNPNFMVVITGEILLGVVLGFYLAPVPAVLVEIFPLKVRLAGLALSYNISAAIFGGTTPLVVMLLIKTTGCNLMPGFYIMMFAFFSLISLCFFKDNYKKSLY